MECIRLNSLDAKEIMTASVQQRAVRRPKRSHYYELNKLFAKYGAAPWPNGALVNGYLTPW